MLNLSVILEDSARRFPQKDAFIFEGRSHTYQQINAEANQVAQYLLGLGILPGDKVALSCPNLPYFPVVYFGILKAGAVVVPLSILLKADEVCYHLADSDAKVYFCFEGTETLPMGVAGYAGFEKCQSCQYFVQLPGAGQLGLEFTEAINFNQTISELDPTFETIATSAEDTAVIIYTSGTTGRPKGAELTHSNLAWNADLCRHLFQYAEDDRLLIVLPLFHIFGQTCLMNAGIMHGLTSSLLVRFDCARVEDLLIEQSITFFAGVPTMYWALLNEGDALKIAKIKETLRRCVSGGASLPMQVLADFEEKYQVPIYEGYGMSEGSPVVTFNQPGRKRKAGSIGTPVWGVEVMVVDEKDQELPIGERGELVYRGHNVMKGYYKRDDVNADTLRNGWMHSGDIALKDEDGYFYIVDRTKDMIIRGGLNVYPREVEELMIQHEAISLVAVVGMPDEKLGEEIKAFVVLQEGFTLDEGTLIEWTKERIAAYKYPRQIKFVDALPMNATGKILKRKLRMDS